jgi:signal peptidase I
MMSGLEPANPPSTEPRPLDADGLTPAQARSARLALALLAPLTALLLAIVLVFFVFYDTTTIDGASMFPTLRDHDYVLITKGLARPQRGDIVVLQVVYKGKAEEWVKRIVALEGDRVSVAGNLIRVNGRGEQFPHMIIDGGATLPVGQTVVGKGQIYVAGDNRDVSLDSRFVGTFNVSSIHGRVLAIYAPILRIGAVPEP